MDGMVPQISQTEVMKKIVQTVRDKPDTWSPKTEEARDKHCGRTSEGARRQSKGTRSNKEESNEEVPKRSG